MMGDSLRTLYLDDNNLDRSLVCDALTREAGGFEIHEAATEQEFRALLDQGPWDLVLSDFHVLGFDGFEVIGLVRERYPDVPVIIVTGTGSEEIAVSALHRGADDYVIKTPSHIQRLPRTISGVMARRSLAAEKAEADREVRRANNLRIALINSMPANVALLNRDGEILMVNEAWKHFAIANALSMPHFAVGANYLTTCDRATGECSMEAGAVAQGIRNVLSGQISVFNIEYPCHSPYEKRWFRCSVTPVSSEAGGAVVMHLNVTDRKQAEQNLVESEARIRTALEGSGVGSWTWDFVRGTATWDRPMHLLFGLTPGRFRGVPSDFLDRVMPEDRGRLAAAVAAVRENGGRVDEEFRVKWPDRSLHVLSIAAQAQPGSDGKPQMLSGICWDVTRRRQRDRQREAIVEVTGLLRNARTPAEVCAAVLTGAMRVCSAAGAMLALLNQQTSFLECETATGKWEALLGVVWSDPKGIPGRSLATLQPYLTNRLSADPAVRYPEKLGGTEHVICVPLVVGEQKLGVLAVGCDFALTQEDADTLAAVAVIAASAINRSQLFAQIEKRLHELASLRAIDQAITSNLDLTTCLGVFLEQVCARLEVDAAAVHLFDSQAGTLGCAATHGFRTPMVNRTPVPVGSGLIGRVAAGLRACIVPDLGRTHGEFTQTALTPEEEAVAYFAFPLVSKGNLLGVLEMFHRSAMTPGDDWCTFAEALAGQAAIAIDNAELVDGLKRSNAELARAYDATIEGWSRAADLRDKDTEDHSRRVTEITLLLARSMGMPESDLVHVRRGSLLHDVGKLGIPDEILLKPGPLTGEEWVIMRRHPVYALEMLAPIDFLRPALDIPWCHHEKWDGTGYPRGLAGTDIPLAARVFAVVDVWDALKKDRPYRKAWDDARVLAHLRQESGSHFDPAVVDAFLRIVPEIQESC